MATAEAPLYKPDGSDKYRGYLLKHWIRYETSYYDRIKLGFIGAQDAGEPFFAERNKTGYDFYSYYLQLQNINRLDRLIVGKYRVLMGMGLVINSNFALGKSMMLQKIPCASDRLAIRCTT